MVVAAKLNRSNTGITGDFSLRLSSRSNTGGVSNMNRRNVPDFVNGCLH